MARSRSRTGDPDLNKSRFFQKLIMSSRPILKQSHPASQLINKTLAREFRRQNLEAYVMVDKEKNAFVLPHGSIFLNTGLLGLIESEEELQFVLGHEISHLDERRGNIEEAKTVREYVSSLRLEEYSSDINSFLRLNGSGRNPEEGIRLMEKMGRGGYDSVHGDMVHRVLNLYWMTRLMDLKGLESEPKGLKIDLDIRKKDLIRKTPRISVIANPHCSRSEAESEIEKCNFFSAIAAYQELVMNGQGFHRILDTEFYIRRYMLFDYFLDRSCKILDNGPGQALAELVRVFCCGDTNPDLRGDNLTLTDYVQALNLKYFDALGVFPLYPEMAAEFASSIQDLRGSRDSRSEFTVAFSSFLGDLPRSAEAELHAQTAARSNPYTLSQELSLENMNERLKGLSPKEAVYKISKTKNLIIYESDVALEMGYEYVDQEVHDKLDDLARAIAELFSQYYTGLECIIETMKAWRAIDLLSSPISSPHLELDEVRQLSDFNLFVETMTKAKIVKDSYPKLKAGAVCDKDIYANQARLHLLENNQDSSDIADILRQSLQIYPGVSTDSNTSYGYQTFARNAISKVQVSQRNRETLEFMYNLSLFLPEFEKESLQSESLTQLWDLMNFDEAYDFLKQNLTRICSTKPIEVLVEEKSKTNKDMERLLGIKDDIADIAMPDGSFSDLLLFEALQKHYLEDRLDLLEGALRTKYEEEFMLDMIDQQAKAAKIKVLQRKIDNEIESFLRILGYPDASRIILDEAYKLDLKYRYGFLRLVLADPKSGVLTQERNRRQVSKRILQSMVASRPDEAETYEVVDKVLNSLVCNAPLRLSYFALVPLLINKIFQKPADSDEGRMSLVGFITDCATNLGSPGVRFLQLLGQYTHVPTEYAAEFQRVYDSLRGQSKLTAYQTVKREFPDFARYYTGIEEAIGGGSITTVYKTRTVQGEQRVLKVLNPNLKYINRLAFDVVREALRDIAAGDSRFAIGEGIIDEIYEWVTRDIDFEGFLQKDETFRSRNEGFQGPNGYVIHVPKSHGPESKYFKIEDYVEGTNLSRKEELLSQGHDLKSIVATICQNYLSQMSNGMIHSDVHPGNFRITPDKRIAILDRNFFLEPDEQSIVFYTSLLGQMMTENSEGLTDALGDHLNLDRGSQVYDGLKGVVDEELKSDKPLTDKLLGVVKYLKSNQVRLPIQTTLLIRNIHAIQKFSEDAGLTTLQQAFIYGNT